MIYWDSASTGLKINLTTKLIDWFDLKLCANPGRANYFSAEKVKAMIAEARKNILNAFGTTSDSNCIFYKSVTEAINAICFSLNFFKGRIMGCPTDHNSIVGPMINSGRYVFLSLDEDHIPSVRNYLFLLNENISTVILTHSSNVLGLVIPANLYGYLCKAKVYLLDASQSVTYGMLDANKIDCSAIIFSAHKLCGITGVGAIVGKNELLSKMRPLLLGGGNVLNFSVSLGEIIFNDIPGKHEAGTQLIYGPSCLSVIMEWRKRFLSRRINYRFRYLWNKICRVKRIKLYNKYTPSTHLVSFIFDGLESAVVSSFLSKFLICMRTGVMCAPLLVNKLGQTAICRISIGIYNSFKDIDVILLTFAIVNNLVLS
ncbi:MAG: aminotransferase class V-fold PLP-dependent enzyme [Candidatus Hodgkinia cicadicola]